MIVTGRVFPNRTAANAACSAAAATWTPPTYTNVGSGPHIDHSKLPPQTIAEPIEMEDGTWSVTGAEHASLRGQSVNMANVKRGGAPTPTQAQAQGKP
jgi:hypothetical protein